MPEEEREVKQEPRDATRITIKHTKCVQLRKFSGNANLNTYIMYIKTEFLRHPKHSVSYKI